MKQGLHDCSWCTWVLHMIGCPFEDTNYMISTSCQGLRVAPSVNGAGQASILTDADTNAPALLPPRQKSSWPWTVTFICVLDLLLNLVLVLLFAGGKLQTQNILPVLMLETLASSIVFLCFASWDDQRHLITAWQVLQAIRFFLLRRTIYAHFGTYVASLLLLLLARARDL